MPALRFRVSFYRSGRFRNQDSGYVPLPVCFVSGSGVRRGQKKRLKDKSARPFPERQFAFPSIDFPSPGLAAFPAVAPFTPPAAPLALL